MGDQEHGKAGVVRELVGAASEEFDGARAASEGAQLPMFPVMVRDRGRKDGEALAAIQRDVERRQEPGRPAGVPNLTTQAFRKWLLGRGVSPLVSLMRYAILPPELLANELGCSKLEAFREWKDLQFGLAPYLHAKLAFVDDEGKPVPFLTMIVGGQHITVASGETPWQARERIAREYQQNQLLGAAVPAVSHAAVSHGGAK